MLVLPRVLIVILDLLPAWLCRLNTVQRAAQAAWGCSLVLVLCACSASGATSTGPHPSAPGTPAPAQAATATLAGVAETEEPPEEPTPAPTDEPTTAPTATPEPTAMPAPTAIPATATPELPTATPEPARATAQVVEVVDGDTLKVALDGRIHTVRLIGMDTPETVHPSKPVECFGQEASAKAHELLAGQTVHLEIDPSQGERDRYDRLLRYVWLPDGRLFNQEMIAQGYAFEYTYDDPYKYQEEFKKAQQEADANDRGLWAPATCNGERVAAQSTPEPAPVEPAPVEPAPVNCDPSYPDFCLEPGLPDLDCSDIPYRRFTVLPPDPHRFDGNDNDGIGCESN